MNTLSVLKSKTEANSLAALMQLTDPAGTHTVCGPDQVKQIITSEAAVPDIIFMDVALAFSNNNRRDSGSSDLMDSIRRTAPDARLIFVAPPYIGDPAESAAVAQAVQPSADSAAGQIAQTPAASPASATLRVQCFGNFEVFKDGKPIRFSRSLSKQALAYLVDRRGAACTVGEMCAMLWEDRTIDSSLKSQARVVLTGLRKDLEAIGEGDVIIKGWNTWSIDPSRLSCDYYDYLDDVIDPRSFRGEYMTQYSWAESTLGVLIQESELRMDFGAGSPSAVQRSSYRERDAL